MYCRNCGNEIQDDSKYCMHCGMDMTQEQEPEQMQEPEKEQEEPVYASTPHPPVSKNRMPLYIGLGIVALIIVCTCVFLVMNMLSEDKTEQKALEASIAAIQAAQEASETEETSETEEDSVPASNTYNNYYYYNTDRVDSYVNSSVDGYLWPTDSAYITSSDLARYSKKQVEAIRNEIYARHGYVFRTEEWKNYFGQRSWYTPNANYNDSWLSSVERENIKTIVAYEKAQGWK